MDMAPEDDTIVVNAVAPIDLKALERGINATNVANCLDTSVANVIFAPNIRIRCEHIATDCRNGEI